MHGGEVGEIDAHHPGSDGTAPALSGVGGRHDPRIAKCLLGGGERKFVRAVRKLQQLAVGSNGRFIETLHLRGDPRGKTTRVEQRDRRGAAPSGEERVPRRRDVVAARRDQTHTGDGDAAFHTPPSVVIPRSGNDEGPAFEISLKSRSFAALRMTDSIMRSPIAPSRRGARRSARQAMPLPRRSRAGRDRLSARRLVRAR